MNNLIIKYHNVDTVKLTNLLKIDKEIVQRIQNTIINLPALSIVENEELLNKMIIQTNNFANNKNSFIVFGTGGSNLGSKALINILQGKEKKRISFYDNIDPIGFKNSINPGALCFGRLKNALPSTPSSVSTVTTLSSFLPPARMCFNPTCH